MKTCMKCKEILSVCLGMTNKKFIFTQVANVCQIEYNVHVLDVLSLCVQFNLHLLVYNKLYLYDKLLYNLLHSHENSQI